jgi:hypothetical protein
VKGLFSTSGEIDTNREMQIGYRLAFSISPSRTGSDRARPWERKALSVISRQ